MCLPAFVCLSVCLLARLLKNACMDLDEMLRGHPCTSLQRGMVLNGFIHRKPLEQLCRRYMRSTECPSSLQMRATLSWWLVIHGFFKFYRNPAASRKY